MADRVLFVDLENVQGIDLSQVPADARVMIFYGVGQKKLPEDLVVRAQPLGSRLNGSKSQAKAPMHSISTSRSISARYCRSARLQSAWCSLVTPALTR